MQFSSNYILKFFPPLGAVANIIYYIVQLPHRASLASFNLLLELGPINFLFDGIGAKEERFCREVDNMAEASKAAVFNRIVNVQGSQNLCDTSVVWSCVAKS